MKLKHIYVHIKDGHVSLRLVSKSGEYKEAMPSDISPHNLCHDIRYSLPLMRVIERAVAGDGYSILSLDCICGSDYDDPVDLFKSELLYIPNESESLNLRLGRVLRVGTSHLDINENPYIYLLNGKTFTRIIKKSDHNIDITDIHKVKVVDLINTIKIPIEHLSSPDILLNTARLKVRTKNTK